MEEETKKIKIFFAIIATLLIIPVASFGATVAQNEQIYNGIDVSDWQRYIDYSQVKSDGIEIVYIKSSQGSNIIDPYFKINYNNAKENGLKVGFYHYLTARNEEEAKQQAEFFASVISNTNPDCKLAMDFESFGSLDVYEINTISRIFLERVKEVTGKEVIIYSDAYNARNVFSKSLAKDYPLWVADYGVDIPGETNWDFWEGFQYTDQGEISGIRGYVDKDKYTSNIFLDDTTQIKQSGDAENYTQDIVYIVKKGNTLSGIAFKYSTTVRELVDLNKIKNPNLIFPGQEITVPINRNAKNNQLYDSGHIIYTVECGDTLSALALKYGTTIENIAKLNNIKNVNLIYIGEKLRIDTKN